MGVYVDADDIMQHFRQAPAITSETIEEVMEEKEYYVQTFLNLTELPPDNPILKDIIRNLTIAAGITMITPAQPENLSKAQMLNSNALRQLREIDDSGLGIVGGSPRPGAAYEVYNPYPPFFTLDDFGLSADEVV